MAKQLRKKEETQHRMTWEEIVVLGNTWAVIV